MEEFKIGTQVKLKSGSLIMTIDFIGLEDSITCKWFVDDKYQEEIFDKKSLIILTGKN
jgi:uncharacterized protein YodC (DUF2158 family)